MAHQDRDKDRGHLGHTVSHTDTAQGKGGGQLTQEVPKDTDDSSPTNRQTGVAGENAKSRDARTSSDPLNAQDPEDRGGPGGA